MIRMIFSTVRAPQEPALTVESLAIRQTGRPSTLAAPVTTPSAGKPVGEHVGERTVLHKGALVDQQRDALAGEQLALGRVGLVVALGAARQHALADLRQLLVGQRHDAPPENDLNDR